MFKSLTTFVTLIMALGFLSHTVMADLKPINLVCEGNQTSLIKEWDLLEETYANVVLRIIPINNKFSKMIFDDVRGENKTFLNNFKGFPLCSVKPDYFVCAISHDENTQEPQQRSANLNRITGLLDYAQIIVIDGTEIAVGLNLECRVAQKKF